MRSGKPMRRDFGLIVSETEVEHTNSGSRTGVKVKDVLPGSAADRAGIMKKDVIVEIDGATIATKEQFRTAMRSELSKSGFRLTLQRAEDEYSYATLFSADRHHDYTYRETTLDVSEIPHVEGMSEEATLLSVLAARTVLGRMKNKKAKRAFELHYLDGLSYSQMVELDKDYFRNENNCCVLAKRGFKEAAFLLEEYASELLKHWSTVLTKEQRTIYRGICEEARQLVKRFEKY
jgi:site-specific recombinase XerD